MIDPYWDNVVLAMPMDGIDGSTNFVDLKGKTVTPYGGAKISTAQALSWGMSAYFDGLGDYLTTPHHTDLNLSSGDFTIEGVAYCTALTTSNQTIICKDGVAGTSYPQYEVGVNSAGHFFASVGSGNGTGYYQSIVSASTITLSQCFHYAFCKSGTTLKLFLKGLLEGSATQTGVMIDGGKSLYIAYQQGQSSSCYFRGYFFEPRITKGIFRYTENFTPPPRSYLSNNIGNIIPPIHTIESAGVAPIVGTGEIIPTIESVAGDDGAIIASGEISPPVEIITASGTSEAVPATNHAGVTPKLESISGSGYTSVVGFGSIIPKRRGTISGSGTSGEWIGNGTIAPRLESVTASGGTPIIGRAAIEDKKGTVDGLGSSAIAGTGRVVGRAPFISGLGFMGVGGSAQIQTLKDIISGSGTSYISGSAAIVPPKEKISASKYNPLSYDTLNFSRGLVVTGGTPAPLVEPLHFSRH